MNHTAPAHPFFKADCLGGQPSALRREAEALARELDPSGTMRKAMRKAALNPMNHTALQNLCSTYINGNISDAKKRARSWSEKRIADCFIEDFGYSDRKARLTAAHMKGADCWQEACDAK